MSIESIVQVITVLFVCTGITYVFFRQLLRLLPPVVHLAFCFALALGFSALLFPAPFQRGAEVCVELSGLPTALRATDERIRAIEDLPQTLVDSLWSTFESAESAGSDDSAKLDESDMRESVEEAARAPDSEDTQIRDARDDKPGSLEGNVVPQVVRIVELLLRGFALAVSALLIAVTLALRMILSIIVPPRSRRDRRARDLENRIEALEAGAALVDASQDATLPGTHDPA